MSLPDGMPSPFRLVEGDIPCRRTYCPERWRRSAGGVGPGPRSKDGTEAPSGISVSLRVPSGPDAPVRCSLGHAVTGSRLDVRQLTHSSVRYRPEQG